MGPLFRPTNGFPVTPLTLPPGSPQPAQVSTDLLLVPPHLGHSPSPHLKHGTVSRATLVSITVAS